MAIQITQATGAGAASPDATLEEAWIGHAITMTLPASASSYSHTILDATDGQPPTLSGATSQTATMTPTRTGSIRWRGTWRIGGVTYAAIKVIRVTKNSSGVETAEAVPPAYLERAGEANGSRGAQDQWDRAFAKVAGSSIPTEAFSPVLRLDTNAIQTASANYSRVFLGLATSGHVVGATKIIRIPANTVAAMSDLVVGSDLNTTTWDPFVPTNDYAISVTAISGNQFISSGRDLGLRDATAPTVSSASVNVGLDANKLNVVFSEPCYLPSLTGISLSFTSEPARTITAIESATSDGLTWGLTLSANFSGSEVCSLVVGASRLWQDLNGNLVATSTTPVTITGAWDTSDLTNLRLWIDPAQGHSTVDGAGVATVTNMGSLGGTFAQGTAANRPTYGANGFGSGLPWFDFDGANDSLASTLTFDDLVADGGEWYFGAVVAVDAISTDAASDTNAAILSESAGYWSAMFRSSNGANAYVFDGGTKLVAASIGATPVAKCLVEIRATGGTLYIRVNKGAEASVAAGDVSVLNGTLRLGANRIPNQYLNGKLGEVWFTQGDPGVTQRNNQADYAKAKYGIV